MSELKPIFTHADIASKEWLDSALPIRYEGNLLGIIKRVPPWWLRSVRSLRYTQYFASITYFENLPAFSSDCPRLAQTEKFNNLFLLALVF